MPIEKRHDDTLNEDYLSYLPPDMHLLTPQCDAVLAVCSAYTNKNLITPAEIRVDKGAITKIVIRVDQRAEYYKLYHNNTQLSEIRKAALLAYWILKYKPFRIEMKDPSKWQNRLRINEQIALACILSTVARNIHRDGDAVPQDDPSLRVSDDYRKKLLHSFREHDLSKEALIGMAESLLETVN